MQDANLNRGTPIFKIRILAQFVSNEGVIGEQYFVMAL